MKKYRALIIMLIAVGLITWGVFSVRVVEAPSGTVSGDAVKFGYPPTRA